MNTNTKILNKLKLSSATYEKAYLPPSGIYLRNASLVQPNNHLIKTIQWGGGGEAVFQQTMLRQLDVHLHKNEFRSLPHTIQKLS